MLLLLLSYLDPYNEILVDNESNGILFFIIHLFKKRVEVGVVHYTCFFVVSSQYWREVRYCAVEQSMRVEL